MKEESTEDSEHDIMNAISHFYQVIYVSNSEKKRTVWSYLQTWVQALLLT